MYVWSVVWAGGSHQLNVCQLLCQLQRRLAHCQNVDLEEEEEVLIRGGGREGE